MSITVAVDLSVDGEAVEQELAGLEQVTVTFDDGTRERTWHGRIGGIWDVETLTTAGDDRVMHVWGRTSQPGVTRRWLKVRGLWDRPVDSQGLPRTTEAVSFARSEIGIRLGTPGWRVEPLTAAGQRERTEREPLEHRRQRLIAHLATLDAGAARELDQVISQLESRSRCLCSPTL